MERAICSKVFFMWTFFAVFRRFRDFVYFIFFLFSYSGFRWCFHDYFGFVWLFFSLSNFGVYFFVFFFQIIECVIFAFACLKWSNLIHCVFNLCQHIFNVVSTFCGFIAFFEYFFSTLINYHSNKNIIDTTALGSIVEKVIKLNSFEK